MVMVVVVVVVMVVVVWWCVDGNGGGGGGGSGDDENNGAATRVRSAGGQRPAPSDNEIAAEKGRDTQPDNYIADDTDRHAQQQRLWRQLE